MITKPPDYFSKWIRLAVSLAVVAFFIGINSPGAETTSILFREDFNGNSLDPTRWQAYPNGGTISLSSGWLTLSASGQTHSFPYVHSKVHPLLNPFSLTDCFAISIGLAYTGAAQYGSGFYADTELPLNGSSTSQRYAPGSYSVWQDTSALSIYRILLGQEVAFSIDAPHLSFHQIEFRRQKSLQNLDVDECYVDGQLTHSITYPTLQSRPYVLWLGDPYLPGIPGNWSSLKVDYLEVRSVDCYNAPTTTSTTTSTSTTTTSTTLCTANPNTLCLNDRQFSVSVEYVDYNTGISGQGKAVSLAPDSGYFWFFNAYNVELMVKALDGRSVNGNFWVFYGALSDVAYTIRVTDPYGRLKAYSNPAHQLASVADTAAFPAYLNTRLFSRIMPARGIQNLLDLLWGNSVMDKKPPDVVSRSEQTGCSTDSLSLCLNQNRFRVRVAWKNYNTGISGNGTAVPLTGDSGYFWFFDSRNIELVLKILDGRGINGKFWVMYGALSDVEYTISIMDTFTGAVKNYYNAPHNLASRADTAAFLAYPAYP